MTMTAITAPPWGARVETDVFEGYASVFNIVDAGGDIVAPGAFRDALRRRGAGGIKLLWQHDPKQPIGVIEQIREDSRGLWLKARLLPDVAKGREAIALLKTGAVDGLSIGFHAQKSRRDAKGVRILTEIDLWEVSLVTFPMNPRARISGLKAAGKAMRGLVHDIQALRIKLKGD